MANKSKPCLILSLGIALLMAVLMGFNVNLGLANPAFQASPTPTAQEKPPLSLLVVDAADWSLWQVGFDSSNPQAIFRLSDEPPIPLAGHLSSREQMALDRWLNSGLADLETDNTSLHTGIIDAWDFHDGKILLQTFSEICDSVINTKCFGYYEFSYIENGTKTTTVLQLDYHDLLLEQFECLNINEVSLKFKDVEINPQKDRFAAIIYSSEECHADRTQTHTIIVDTALGSVQRYDLPSYGVASWSPSGHSLALMTLEECQTQQLCAYQLKIFSVATRHETTLPNTILIPASESDFLNVRWIGNDVFVYQTFLQDVEGIYTAKLIWARADGTILQDYSLGERFVERLYEFGDGLALIDLKHQLTILSSDLTEVFSLQLGNDSLIDFDEAVFFIATSGQTTFVDTDFVQHDISFVNQLTDNTVLWNVSVSHAEYRESAIPSLTATLTPTPAQ